MAHKSDILSVADVDAILSSLKKDDTEKFVTVIHQLIDKTYRTGYKDAVENYAVWCNGEQLVGVLKQPLKKILQEVDQAKVPIRY